MSWKSLVDTFLAGTKRKQEIKVENQSEYEKWLSNLYSEIEVFVKRVNRLDLVESEDRTQFYELIDRFSTRIQELRERNESSSASNMALIELDQLVKLLEDTSAPIALGRISLDNDPFNEAKRKQREKKNIERARGERDVIADQIQKVMDGLEGGDS